MKAARPSLASWVAIRRVEIEPLDLGEAPRARRASIWPRAARTAQAQRGGALACEVLGRNRRARRLRDRRRARATRPHAQRLVGADRRPDSSRSSAAALADAVGSRHDAAGANTPSLISGWPSLASGAAKIRSPASASSSRRPGTGRAPRPASAPGTRACAGAARAAIASIAAQLRRQVLLDAGAEAEMRPLGIEQHAAQRRRLPRCASSAPCSAAIIAASTTLAFGPRQAQAQQARRRARARPSSGAWRHGSCACCLRLDARRAARRPSLAAASAWRSATNRPRGRPCGPSLKARKPARASVIMLSASQAREFSLFRFQASSLGLRSSSIVLVVQSGKVSSILAHSSSTFASSMRQVDRAARHQRLGLLRAPRRSWARRRRCGRTRRDSAAVSTSGLATNLPSTFSAGTMSVSMPRLIGLVRRERLAQHAGGHRALGADHQRQEVGRAADRRRAVLGAGLAEARQVLRDREVAGHADFLAAADAHAVDAADHRLVAAEDRRDHVVEQAHVLAVFLRIAGVVLGVFLGVAAGAEGLVAGAGEHHATTSRALDAARKARITPFTMSVV